MPRGKETREGKITFPNAEDHWGPDKVAATRRVMAGYERMRREVDQLLKLGKPEITVRIHTTEPIRFIPFSDQHLFDTRTDDALWCDLVRRLMVLGTYGMVLGDFLQGYNPQISDLVSTAMYDMTGQIKNGRQRLQPLIDKGKILFAVDNYAGHEAWTEKLARLNAIDVLLSGMRQPDGSPFQVVYNGGLVIFEYPNGYKDVWQVSHNPGGGSSVINPVGAQRRMAGGFTFDNEKWPGVVVGGHHHRVAATAHEVYLRRDRNTEVPRVLMSLGTFQGVEPRAENDFLIQKGVGLSCRPGAAMVVTQEGKGIRHWPTFGYGKSDVLYPAITLWDTAEKQGIGAELFETVAVRVRPPRAVFNQAGSREAGRSDESVVKAPLYEMLSWDINGGFVLPIVLYLITNARFGSNFTDEKRLKEAVGEVGSNPFAFGLVGRHMVARSVARDGENRDRWLQTMARTMAPMAKKGRLLGIMLSSSLRDDSWKKPIGRGENQIPGIITGDYLYRESQVRGVPLYPNDALISLQVGETGYWALAEDQLSGSGSEENPFLGLIRAAKRNRLNFDFVFGGHNPGVGVLSTEGTDYIAPGWYSRFDSKGKANEREVPSGGQAVVLFPDRRLLFSAATFRTGRDMHRALLLAGGLTVEEKKKVMARRSRR